MAHNSVAFFRCRCFLTDNFFSHILKRHVDSSILQTCSRADVTDEFKRELHRRETLEETSVQRRRHIHMGYEPLYKELYHLDTDFFNENFVTLVALAQNSKDKSAILNSGLLTEHHPEYELYVFPVFTKEFCERFVEELKYFEESDLPKGRPNTMNNNGLLLDELGMNETFFDILRKTYMEPLAKLLFPENSKGSLDSHKVFTVHYSADGDLDLACHFDNAEVTLNVSLSAGHDDGDLYFGAMRGQPEVRWHQQKHIQGHGILHRGQQMHGALPVTYGERQNLIVWMRSSAVRNPLCPMCDRPPDLLPAAGYGDGFTCEKPPPAEVDVCSMI